MNLDISENRSIDCETAYSRNLRIKTHTSEHIPSSHGSEVVISGKTVDGVMILFVDDSIHHLLCLPRLTNPVVGPGNLEAGLISAGIPFIHISGVKTTEEMIKTLLGLLFSTANLHQSCNVIGHHPEIVGIGGFAPVFIHSFPRSVGIATLEPTCLGIEKIFP